ncbi:hypothetical protein BWZ20_14700 [Winogradskyella sp. J14-2]|uniref:Brp/Blh family beta-carotene 15,15'-dioxygenase n=1 Tax=Winogradskyella sp. J14-2 TaxID=1936080 RepID=UPI000972BE75|nr:Brp/Blh family beta-carotene 15,15'-dioxygenase [Winogradskyella sp. J14-2]APY09718.1 hypothetical protein BWZ20_14700 [Winogradskyella sp. J14-2]
MKFPVFNLIITVFLFWLTIQVDSQFEKYLSYILVCSVGILHGANDISILSILVKGYKGNKFFLALYIILILSNIFIFFTSPLFALIVFIAISCYHFGEQHYSHFIKQRGLKSSLFFFSYGFLIFGLLFYTNLNETNKIVFELAGVSIRKDIFLYFLWFGIISTILSTIINSKNFTAEFNYLQELFLILLFALLFNLATLLWAFAIYFVVWHSVPSLIDQIKVLYGDTNKIHWINYIKTSFIYWLISIVGLVLLYFGSIYLQFNFITSFFAFLAAITVPHVIVMYFFNKN